MKRKADSKYDRSGAHDNLCRQLVSGRWQRYGKRRQFGQTVTQGAALPYRMRAPVITQLVHCGDEVTPSINASENATANVTISNVNIDTSGAAVSPQAERQCKHRAGWHKYP